ncbi:MAG: patatin-like phospholipase family protein [Deltaproteobacteria bacterium]|nr:patatin-like phospholipase family protein [Deltaproteobacteria bacterium]
MAEARLRSIVVRAGARARALIAREGFRPSLFGGLLGASGGPKWLALHGIDRVLAERFLPRRGGPLALLGSSIGTFRHAALAQRDPLAALERFRAAYLAQRYSARPTPADVSEVSRQIVTELLGASGAREIIERADLSTHVVTVRSRALTASERRPLLALGLGASALANVVDRRLLGVGFERVLFHTGAAPRMVPGTLPTRAVPLTAESLPDALLASGSIPLVLAGVRDVGGAPPGVYRDGGVVDYHFDFELERPEGLLLMPHFSRELVPGWFDKGLRRRARGPALDDLVLIAPSAEGQARFPGGQVPDRKDFARFADPVRVSRWQAALGESARMGDELAALFEDPDPVRHMATL